MTPPAGAQAERLPETATVRVERQEPRLPDVGEAPLVPNVAPDPDDGRRGSSDIGNLSHYLPSMHPVLAIVEPEIPGHSIEFCEATTSDRGRQTLLNAAKMLAMTAFDYLTSAEMREQVAAEFNQSK